MELRPWQEEVLPKLDSGKVLYGPVGSGKSIAALAYFVEYEAHAREEPTRLIVITTARKRDSGDWIREALLLDICENIEESLHGSITVDSWNNILNYIDCENCFFIFDEQRLVGNGEWVKNFQRIAQNNRWLLLTGTPGDTWLDYAPIFIANGFYRNITAFKTQHVLYDSFVKFPKVKGYFDEVKLELIRNELLVEMPMPRHTKRFINWLYVDHDKDKLDQVFNKRWNIYEEKPIKDAGEMWRLMRKVVNTDPDRVAWVKKLLTCHDRLIVYYNFDYELDILRSLEWLQTPGQEFEVAEYNGHRHDPTPTGDRWVYLVQYVSGAEAWNCTSTDAMVFYSLTYSWKNFEQCQGRIDRLNTDYVNLYYYVLVSNTLIDRAIRRALEAKKRFNERKAAIAMAKKSGLVKVEEDELEGEYAYVAQDRGAFGRAA